MWFDTVINLAKAVGTIAVAIAAIWGDRLREWLNPLKARTEVHNVRGKKEFAPPEGGTLIFYHLKVVNGTHWRALQNCRVLLTEIQRKHPDGSFHIDPFPVPRQFFWAPSELSPAAASFTKERIFDFGVLRFSDATFRPTLLPQGGELHANVAAGEAVRYRLKIVADNFDQPGGQLFEVAFDGKCSEDLDQMSRSLVIREVRTDAV